jgi:spore maturation protein CgeB
MSNLIKILLVGDFIFPIYEEAFEKGFLKITPSVYRFSLNYPESKSVFSKLLVYFERRLAIGFLTNSLNKRLVETVLDTRPDLVMIYRGRNIFPSTYKMIRTKLPNTKIFIYNNDDPFSKKYPFYFWLYYKSSLIYFHHIFCYRQKNINDLAMRGYRNTSILMSYYIGEKNYLYNKKFTEREIDVVFIGHFENDGRDEILNFLLQNGISVKIFGTNWNKSKLYNILSLGNQIERVNVEKYNDLLNQTKIALVFLSKLNNDEYTRRNFEIPASGAVMFSEKTKILQMLYQEETEVVFFIDKFDLLQKIKFYLMNIDRLQAISDRAYIRLKATKSELNDRINQIIEIYHKSN